jgi:hypothetical protein
VRTLRRLIKPGIEITQTEALNLLSQGFTWDYDEPWLRFKLPDGTVVLLEDRHAARWYQGR